MEVWLGYAQNLARRVRIDLIRIIRIDGPFRRGRVPDRREGAILNFDARLGASDRHHGNDIELTLTVSARLIKVWMEGEGSEASRVLVVYKISTVDGLQIQDRRSTNATVGLNNDNPTAVGFTGIHPPRAVARVIK